MRKICLLITLLSFYSSSLFSETKRILFIGNSYCYVNDLPTALRKIALSLGDTLVTDGNMMGGYTLAMHAADANTLAKIQLGNWDYVVIQAQSQEPSFPPSQVQSDTYPYATVLDSLVKLYNPCAETIFFMTWGRKNGDAANCVSYPPLCTYEGMQQRLRESYIDMAQSNHASVSPVGVSWRTCRLQYPSLELYQPDESHPSELGTYLAACTFYSSLYHRTALNADTVFASVNSTIAHNIQQLSFHTVMDSIENWQQAGDLPLANFSVSTSNLSATFTNQSMRSNAWFWDFGDGTNSTQANPVKNYTNAGNYTVKLTASDTCLSDTKVMQLSIGGPSNSSVEQLTSAQCTLDSGHTIQIDHANGATLLVYAADGKLVLKHIVQGAQEKIEFNPKNTGVYVYQLMQKKKLLSTGKWLINY